MPKIFSDDTGVSVIVGALLLILITVVAAAALAMIVSQAEQNYASRQAQEDAISNENLKIIAIKPTYDTNATTNNGNLECIDITIQNVNTNESEIGRISLNDAYTSQYTVVGGPVIYKSGTDWLTVPAAKSVIVHLVLDTTDFPTPPTIKNTDQIKVQVSTGYYNFFERTFMPPVASAKFQVNTENLGLVQRDYVTLDGSDSTDETGQIKIYQWNIQEYITQDEFNGYWYNISPIVTSGNKIRFTPPSNGPFKVILTVKDNQNDANAMIASTDEMDIPADPNFSPPLTLNAVYYLNNTTIMAKLRDALGNPCSGKLVTFQPGSNVMVNQTSAVTDINGIAVTNVSFSGATLGTVTVSYDKLTANVQVSALTIPPTANFNAYSTTPNSGDTVQFYDTSDHGTGGSITSWVWDFGDGSPQNTGSGNPTHIYINLNATIYKYTVQLIVTNNAGTSAPTVKTELIAVKPARPLPDFTPPNPIINGSPAVFTGSYNPSGGTPYAYNWAWDFGDNGTGSGQTTPHTYVNPGTYIVKLTVQNDGGSNSVSKNVTVT